MVFTYGTAKLCRSCTCKFPTFMLEAVLKFDFIAKKILLVLPPVGNYTKQTFPKWSFVF